MVDHEITTFFNRLYDNTYLKVMRFVTVKCSNPDDIADIVQEVFAEAYAVLMKKGVDYIDNENAFIFHIAKSKIYKHYSLAQRLKNMLPLSRSHNSNDEDYDVSIDDLDLESQQASVEEVVINRDTVDKVWQTLKSRPADVQKIFFLYYYCEMSLKEIASDLNLSESNVKHKLYRTLEQIRSIYRKGGESL